MLRRLLVTSALFVACGKPSTEGMGLLVQVRWDNDVTARCFKLQLFAAGRPTLETQPMPRADKSSLQVGVFRADLPEEVSLQAMGYSDEACRNEAMPPERSPLTAVRFLPGIQDVSLQVSSARLDGGFSDGGEDGGFDGGPDAGIDAGFGDAGVDGGMDAGADAGADDAGNDAGLDDAGVDGGADAGVDAGVDAGIPETCNNRMDDDGDGLADCADSDCGVGTACDDGDACTQSDSCGASGTCAGTPLSCAGPVPVCSMPSGCDAGSCTVAPRPARTFCDGGQCDGAGRCAPFCDAARKGLGACYQFENTLDDGSQYGHHGTGTLGFASGARGQGYAVAGAGIVVGDFSSLNCSTDLTVEAWVRLSSWPAAGTRFGVVDNDSQYGMFIGPGGTLRCSAGVLIEGGSVSLNAWHHLACIFDGASLRAYLDGAQVQMTDTRLPDGGNTQLSLGNANGLTLGQNSPSGDALDGVLDGVRVFCESLAPADLCTTPGECG